MLAWSELLESETVLHSSATGVEPGGLLARRGMVELLIAHFKLFLRPFRGPATKHLGGYVAWFVARQPGRERWHRETARRLLFGFEPTLNSDMAGRSAAGLEPPR